MAEQKWQPIETAPKDGTRILLWMAYPEGGEIEQCIWSPRHGAWASGDAGWGSDRFDESLPTHWMPLPDPPC